MVIMWKSTEITKKKAREMEKYVKEHATKTIIDYNFSVCCVMGTTDVKYYFIYENEYCT